MVIHGAQPLTLVADLVAIGKGRVTTVLHSVTLAKPLPASLTLFLARILAGRLNADGRPDGRSLLTSPAAHSAKVGPRRLGRRLLSHADDAEERHGSRQRPSTATAARCYRPPVVDPMRRYRQPPPPALDRAADRQDLRLDHARAPRRRLRPRGGLYLYGHETLNAIGPRTAAVKRAQKDCRACRRRPRRRQRSSSATTSAPAPTASARRTRGPTR